MTLINTQGMAFIGPGSEWFWTAISGVILAITFVAIYRQLRVQRAASATDQLDRLLREWSSERLARAKLALLMAMQAGVAPDALPARPVSHIGFFWNQIGYLVRTGQMDRGLVFEQLGDQLQWWWAALGPWVRRSRSEDGDPDGWQHFELLAREATAADAKRGVVRQVDGASITASVPGLVQMFTEAVELEEALRAVTVKVTPLPVPVETARASVKVAPSTRDIPGGT